MPRLTDADIVALIQHETTTAAGYMADGIADRTARALNLYFNNASSPDVPAAPEGRSDAVSADVADVTHSLLAQMAPMIKSSLVEFVPDAEADEDQAQMETDFIADLLERNDAYTILNESFFDGILSANGWVKAVVEREEEVTREKYKGVDELFLEQVTQEDDRRKVELTELTENKDGTLDLQVTVTVTDKRLVIESVAPENMLHSANTSAHELQEIVFVAELKMLTVSELIDLGLTEKEAMAVPRGGEEYMSGAVARQEGLQRGGYDGGSEIQDAATLRACFDVYYLIDMDRNGRLERWHFLRAGDYLPIKERYTHVPYVTGSMIPIPHRLQGMGVGDMFGDLQTQKTVILRQYLDNLAVANRSRLGYVEGAVNVEHLGDGRVNGCVAMQSPDAIVPLPNTDIGPQSIMGLNYLDTIRTQRGGGAVNYNEAEMQLAKASTEGALGLAASKEMMAGWYCYNLVNTILKNVYLLVHRCLREYWRGPLRAKINGKWQTTNPAEWAPREYVQTMAGLTEGERRRKTQSLTVLIQQQQGWLQNGGNGIITDYAKLHQAQRDWLTVNGIQQPEQYLIDPSSPEAQQAMKAQAEQAQAQQQQMAQMQMAVYQIQKAIEDQKDATARWKHETELRFKYFDTLADAETKEAEITVDAMNDAAKTMVQGAQSGNGQDTRTDQ